MRQKIGIGFLILTLLLLVTAMQNGGWWWIGVTLSCAVTLWGIGFTSESGSKKK